MIVRNNVSFRLKRAEHGDSKYQHGMAIVDILPTMLIDTIFFIKSN